MGRLRKPRRRSEVGPRAFVQDCRFHSLCQKKVVPRGPDHLGDFSVRSSQRHAVIRVMAAPHCPGGGWGWGWWGGEGGFQGNLHIRCGLPPRLPCLQQALPVCDPLSLPSSAQVKEILGTEWFPLPQKSQCCPITMEQRLSQCRDAYEKPNPERNGCGLTASRMRFHPST